MGNEQTVGIDGSLYTPEDIKELRAELGKAGIGLRTDLDPAEELWTDRPPIPKNKVEIQPLEFAGETAQSKIERVRQALRERYAESIVISALDDIAWLLNLRGSDVHCNPVFVSYVLLTLHDVTLFIDSDKLDETVKDYLKETGVKVRPYEEAKVFSEGQGARSKEQENTNSQSCPPAPCPLPLAPDNGSSWACEARRYYFNICGKYGPQVQAVLKKVAPLGVKTICPLHGPVLAENLEYYIGKYNTWSSYAPEDQGVLLAYASIYGHTAKAAQVLAKELEGAGVPKVVVSDLARSDMAEVIEDAFRYDRMVVMAPTYDAGLFPVMEDFLNHLKAKNYSNRKVGIVENGTWAPMAAKKMTEILSTLKNVTLCETTVTVKSSLSAESLAALKQLAKELA